MNKSELQKQAVQIRQDILTMIHQAGSGHPGGSLSAVEIMTALYFGGVMKVDPENPDWAERDYLILSKGHVAPVLYSVLCRKGFFAEKHLSTLRRLDSILQGHPHAKHVPGLEASSGSLGQGLSVANGIAMGHLRQNRNNNRVYCLMGDGELQEGQIWEAAMTAAQHKLYNLCAIVDNNHVQLDGMTADIKMMEPLAEKWEAFGWHVIPVDGHDFDSLLAGFQKAEAEREKPSVLIAETVKGKGISFMENQAAWHGLAPDAEQYQACMKELSAEGGVL